MAFNSRKNKFGFYLEAINRYSKENEIAADEQFIKGSIVDPRDGNEYLTVQIRDQVWMAENLRYTAGGEIGSLPYIASQRAEVLNRKDIPELVRTYGLVYSWTSVMAVEKQFRKEYVRIEPKHRGICPEGWHVPSIEEWSQLS